MNRGTDGPANDRADSRAAYEASVKRAIVTAIAAAPLAVLSASGPGGMLVGAALTAVVQVLADAAGTAGGRAHVVVTGFEGMTPDDVAQWLHRDTRHLGLAVQVVQQAAATFDREKIHALGRAFRDGVITDAKVDESTFVIAALGAVERPHIEVLRLLAGDEAPPPPDAPLAGDITTPSVTSTTDDGRPIWHIRELQARLPALAMVIPWLASDLRTAGITIRQEGFGDGGLDVQLSTLGTRCLDYLGHGPDAAA